MKQIIFILLIFISVSLQAQTTKAPTKKPVRKELKGGGDGIDNRMHGPNGERVLIGDKGGRYYINATGNKVYMPSKKSKQTKKVKSLLGL
jgi:hypothetical protein